MSDITIIIIIFSAIVFGYVSYKAIKFKKDNGRLALENSQLKQDNRKLKQVERIKSEFINIAAHQLRTPLTKTKWMIQSLVNGDLGVVNAEQKEVLESGYHSNERMIELLNDLLDVGKTEDVRLGYNFKRSSIEKTAEETVKSFLFVAKKKKINLSLIKNEASIPEILMDARKISLVIGNLIDNAINYTPEGGAIGVILENFGNYVKVSVKDNGIGIPKEEIDRIFTRFFRAKNAMRVQTDGTGLGLYIARNIIKVHGGDIWVESEEGKGTTVYFTLQFHSKEDAKKNIEEFIKSI